MINQKIKKRIDAINNPEAIELFFRNLNYLLENLNLSNEDERLSLNVRNDSSKRFSVNLNNRLVFTVENNSNFSFMINDEDLQLLSNVKILLEENFVKQKPKASLIKISFLDFENNKNEIIPLWIKSCTEYLPAQKSSTYRNHHISDFYMLAINYESMLTEYFNHSGTKKEFGYKNLKLEFLSWMVETNNGNHFINQFKGNKENFLNSLNLFEKKYEECFDTKLFGIDLSNLLNEIEILRLNIYDKDNPFFNFNLSTRTRLPSAILGKKNYLYFLKNYHNQTNINSSKMSTQPKNQILYGPPGTGKTYKTKELAVQIANPNFKVDELKAIDIQRKEIVAEYDRLFQIGQINFTTFHQSMSYEDFVEGIKPETKDNNVLYNIKDGTFKRMTKDCIFQYLKQNNIEETEDFDELYSDYILKLKPKIGVKQGTFKTKTGIEIMLVDANESSILVKYVWSNNKKEAEGIRIFSVTKDKLKKVLQEQIDPRKVKNLKTELYPLTRHIVCELFAVYKDFYDFVLENKGEIETVHFEQNETTFKEIIDEFNLLTQDEIQAKQVNNFALIIDEINRGNVSAIFGELITLLEEDKRLGKSEAIQIELPYSKTKFGVPQNLYIIGTMNTADRSVEALDTALRRRFSFTEILPEPKLLEKKTIDGINLNTLLEIINKRVEILLDTDHTIGHSYFLNAENADDLRLIFKNNIIPLLQEYFYGDYEKIGLILGKDFFEAEEKIKGNSHFAPFFTKNHSFEKSIFKLKAIDKDFDIISALQTLLHKNSDTEEDE
jgi:5-methylcytosine-specific restriction endonuclease McrBC GTP-binding regulatory subunit McrB